MTCARRTQEERDALRVRCDYCDAPPMVWCHSRRVRPLGDGWQWRPPDPRDRYRPMHLARRNAAALWRAEMLGLGVNPS